ncbi:hypothetical protein HDV03_003945 [Kappamyces sp. JEL0829]|nr:hypothetical protein HDV03_003945 [Kappamyces sp. JEL0829]
MVRPMLSLQRIRSSASDNFSRQKSTADGAGFSLAEILETRLSQRRSPEEQTSPGRIPLSPWNKGGQNSIQVQLLIDLAGYLMMYGAPLYRVSLRIQHAARLFESFYLPTDLMISVLDTATNSSKTCFLEIPAAANMKKLEAVDRLCKNIFQKMIEDGHTMSGSHVSLAPSVVAEETAAYERIAKELADVAAENDSLSDTLEPLAQAFTCLCLVVLCFKAGLEESIVTFFLGLLTYGLNKAAIKVGFTRATPIFVSFGVSLVSNLFQVPEWWTWTGSRGYCSNVTTLASLMYFMPGSQFALSMLEFGMLPVASAVRLFLAFLKSFQVGYGIAMGAKVAQMILNWAGIVLDPANSVCPTAEDMKYFDLWRVVFFPPMIICIMILYKAHYYQWPYMIASTVTSFIISLAMKPYVSAEVSIMFTSLSLGIIANTISRHTDHPAICAIYAGVFWLLPGGLSVSGASSLISGIGGSDFGLQIMLRTLSLSIGLYVANVLVFPVYKRPDALEESLAI